MEELTLHNSREYYMAKENVNNNVYGVDVVGSWVEVGMRVKLDCARVQIHRFHNGGHFCDLTPMKKSSITHESVNNGITTEGHIKKDLNISLFMPLLDQVKADAPIVFKTADHPDSYHKSVLEASNILGYIVLPIYGEMGCIGYLMCQWCSWSKFDAVDDVTATELAVYVRDQLNALLTLGVPHVK